MLNHDPTAKTHNRLGFLLFMVLALHISIILGLGFYLNAPKARPAKRIDITLSHYHEEKPVIDADFIAQSNQSASGTESTKKEMTATQIPLINSSVDTPIQTVDLRQAKHANETEKSLSTQESNRQITSVKETDSKTTSAELDGEDSLQQRQLEIAALKAKLDQQKQAYARLPNTRRLSSVATKSAPDAAYLYKWQQRIELIGNQYYPPEARRDSLYGDLQMLVSIDQRGKLISARILKSSGHTVLDQAALRIVRLASPYDPPSNAVLKGADTLEIVRMWQFKKNRFSQGS